MQTIDRNWDLLKKEQQTTQTQRKSIKRTQPSLLLLEKTNGFMYNEWDGTVWNKRLRNADPSNKAVLTSTQHRLRDNILTVLALTGKHLRVNWVTPYQTKEKKYDNTYALFSIGETWYCVIDDKAYEESTRRTDKNKGYVVVTFSTKNKPVFTIENTNKLLDELIGTAK